MSAAEPVNIAPATPYTIAPKPNYENATGVPATVLTDGRRASRRFWTGSDSIGWYYSEPIIYRQDFTSLQTISRVEIGTGQSARSEVGLPQSVLVYAKGANGSWGYLGDAAASADTAADGVQTLALDVSGIGARGIAIVVYRSSPYVALDEVRVLATPGPGAAMPAPGVADVAADAAGRRRAAAAARAGTMPIGDDPAGRFGWPLDASGAGANSACTMTRISPWTESDPAAIAAAPADAAATLHATGGWLTMALRVENRSAGPLTLRFAAAQGKGTGAVETLIAHYVLALDGRWRADVLIPMQTATVPPGSMVLAIIRAPVTAPGGIEAAADADCGREQMHVSAPGHAIAIPAGDRPYGTAWSYLTGPLINLERCGSALLTGAWIDTAVVNQSALEPVRTQAGNDLLRAYLRTFSGTRRLLLYMQIDANGWALGNEAILDQQLTAWWRAVSAVIQQEAYKGEVVLYPVDEARGARIETQQMVARLLRRIAPGYKIFATIDNEPAAFATAADIKQFADSLLSGRPRKVGAGVAPQLYAVATYSKTLSLTGYYRRMGWLSFAAGWQGAGIWSMWDANGADQPKLGWTDFGGRERDFNLAYADRNGCPLPSRRLLAFHRGLEDFALLSACKQGGTASIRSLARQTAHVSDINGTDLAKSPFARRPITGFDAALSALGPSCGPEWNTTP